MARRKTASAKQEKLAKEKASKEKFEKEMGAKEKLAKASKANRHCKEDLVDVPSKKSNAPMEPELWDYPVSSPAKPQLLFLIQL